MQVGVCGGWGAVAYYAAAPHTDPPITTRKHDKGEASKTAIFISSKHDKGEVPKSDVFH